MKAGCDETQSMFHAGYAMSTLYTQHVCNLLYKVKMVNTYQHRELKDYGKQNAELKKANHELTKGVKLLRQNASAGAKERCEYCDLLMESQAENDHL
jgi:cell division protein FtsB